MYIPAIDSQLGKVSGLQQLTSTPTVAIVKHNVKHSYMSPANSNVLQACTHVLVRPCPFNIACKVHNASLQKQCVRLNNDLQLLPLKV